jgi:hypothetical protein
VVAVGGAGALKGYDAKALRQREPDCFFPTIYHYLKPSATPWSGIGETTLLYLGLGVLPNHHCDVIRGFGVDLVAWALLTVVVLPTPGAVAAG